MPSNGPIRHGNRGKLPELESQAGKAGWKSTDWVKNIER
jgi:hypothetical protein